MATLPAQQNLFPTESPSDEVLNLVLAELPPLPSVIRYYDEFDGTLCSIRNPDVQLSYDLTVYGQTIRLDFTRFEKDHGQLLKQVFRFLLSETLSVGTVATYLLSASHLSRNDVVKILRAGPHGIGTVWAHLRGRELPTKSYIVAKALLRLLCRYRLQNWSDAYEPFVRTTLPLPAMLSHVGVRSGDAFLSIDEEAAIVRHLDDMVSRLASMAGPMPSSEEIRDAGMLLCSYQFAMRPVQIAMLAMRNVRIWSDGHATPTVHLTFHMAKQCGDSRRHALTRRVKREWVPIFVALHDQRKAINTVGDAHLFTVDSSYEVSVRIARLVRRLIGSDDMGNATDLRHTAAQRLVDAGASHEELAEFMGHSHLKTGLVYYQTSASHAERVNRALGASDIYRRVAKIAHDRFITAEELAHLKGEQQVAGVPHGIPIAGIGGCSSGQPTCPYNPVTACYGCRKFMPLRDKAIHEQVLADMRSVVLFFSESSRGDTHSPAYLQLQRTITEIQTVLAELDAGQS